jgi:hypothetical protein
MKKAGKNMLKKIMIRRTLSKLYSISAEYQLFSREGPVRISRNPCSCRSRGHTDMSSILADQ